MNIIEENAFHLEEGIGLMNSIPNSLYQSVPSGLLSGIGGHIRHIYDFYSCFLNVEKGNLNYDKRERKLIIEQSKVEGIHSFGYIKKHIELLSLERLNEEIIVTCNETATSSSPAMKSSIGRELQFLLSHTIHHYAIIKFILFNEKIELDEDFGVAPSTLQHLKNLENQTDTR